MGWYWNPYAVPGFAGGAVAWALAGVVLLAAPGRSQNRRLAFVLFLEGTTALLGGGLVLVTDTVSVAHAAQATAFLAFGVMVLGYVHFLATLPSPLTRPLRRRWVDAALVGAMLAFALWFLLRTELFLAGVVPGPLSRLVGVGGPLLIPVILVPSVLVFFFGLVSAIAMWRTAPPASAARRQGATYALAFTIRDVAWTVFLFNLFVFPAWWFGPQHFNLVLAAVYGMLAYGILRHQLFDIDLRIKRGLGRSVVVAAVAAAFFVASETAESLVPVDGRLLGLAAAAVVALAAVPLHRLATRALDRLLPAVTDSKEYRARRKRDVYAAALEELSRDGRLSPADHAQLAALQSKLGLEAP